MPRRLVFLRGSRTSERHAQASADASVFMCVPVGRFTAMLTFGNVWNRSALTAGNVMTKLDSFLTVAEAAELLGVSPNTIRNWGKAGKITEYRHPINNYRLFKSEELEELLEEVDQPAREKQRLPR